MAVLEADEAGNHLQAAILQPADEGLWVVDHSLGTSTDFVGEIDARIVDEHAIAVFDVEDNGIAPYFLQPPGQIDGTPLAGLTHVDVDTAYWSGSGGILSLRRLGFDLQRSKRYAQRLPRDQDIAAQAVMVTRPLQHLVGRGVIAAQKMTHHHLRQILPPPHDYHRVPHRRKTATLEIAGLPGNLLHLNADNG